MLLHELDLCPACFCLEMCVAGAWAGNRHLCQLAGPPIAFVVSKLGPAPNTITACISQGSWMRRREQKARGSSPPILFFCNIAGQESWPATQRNGSAAGDRSNLTQSCTALDLHHWHFENAHRRCTWHSRSCATILQGRVHMCMHFHTCHRFWQGYLCTEKALQ